MLCHLLLLLLVVRLAERLTPLPAAGDPTNRGHRDAGGGGGGGNGLAYITLPPAPRSRTPAAQAPVPARVPKSAKPPKPMPRQEPKSPVTPSVAPPVVPAPPVDADTSASPADASTDSGGASSQAAGGAGAGAGGGVGGGQGGGRGSGVGAGEGPGNRPGAGGGDSGAVRPPQPRQLVLPPSDYPKSLRGRTFDVTFWVDAQGRVQRIEVAPAIEPRGFAKKFEETMRNYQFRPARSPQGQPVPGSITIKITL